MSPSANRDTNPIKHDTEGLYSNVYVSYTKHPITVRQSSYVTLRFERQQSTKNVDLEPRMPGFKPQLGTLSKLSKLSVSQ